MLSEGEQQNGLGVGVELGEFALEVDAAHQRGVKAVGAGVGWRPGAVELPARPQPGTLRPTASVRGRMRIEKKDAPKEKQRLRYADADP